MPYEGEKYEIKKVFFEKYKAPENSKESGLVRIRFVVNCEGKPGLFRMQGMDENYEEKVFNKNITDQLMRLTKSLTGWRVMGAKENKSDYYVYLIFKIRNGELIEIMP